MRIVCVLSMLIIIILFAIAYYIYYISVSYTSVSDSWEDSGVEKPRVFIDDYIVQMPDEVIVRITGLSDWDYSVVVRVSGCVNKLYEVTFKGMGEESVTVRIPQERLLYGCVLKVEVFYGDELLDSKEIHVGILK